MKRIKLVLILILCVNFSYAGLLYDILDGKYKAKAIDAPRSMLDGEHYTALVKDGKAVVKYDYKTGGVVDTLFSVSRLKKSTLTKISGYELSPNETKMLVYTNEKMNFRRTFTADYSVYDIKRNEITPLSENGSQEVPLFSPDGRYIAFARDNNLFMKKLDYNTEIAITTDGKAGGIINGTPDWVYEEEFSGKRYFDWSPDSKLLAFVKFDESKVPQYSFVKYLGNADIKEEFSLYPTTFSFKYPKAGENNSTVSVCVYEDLVKLTRTMKLGTDDGEFYIPRIKWTNSPEQQLAIFKLNRNQNRLDMLFANPRSTLSKLILRQDDKAYVEYENIDFIQFTADNKYFFAVTENDGYRHIYHTE